MKVRVDRDLCIGAGNCAALAPTVFELDSPSVDDDILLEAAENRPENAIILEDEYGHQVYP
jgi:ferredoxin